MLNPGEDTMRARAEALEAFREFNEWAKSDETQDSIEEAGALTHVHDEAFKYIAKLGEEAREWLSAEAFMRMAGWHPASEAEQIVGDVLGGIDPAVLVDTVLAAYAAGGRDATDGHD